MKQYRQMASLLGLMLVLSACGGAAGGRKSSAASSAATRECILPNGSQDNSLAGQWLTSALPLKLSFHTGSSWSATELSILTAAADTWNQFFQVSKGGSIFNYGTAGAENTTTTNVTIPDCDVTNPTYGTAIYKRGVWTNGASVIGLTSYCRKTVSGSSLKIMTNAIIQMNYQNFFTQASGRFPDLQSIMLHELGHLIGLEHSCGPVNDGLPNVDCPASAAADTLNIIPTVMYPDWNFTNNVGEEKRVLKENDMGRANCLY